MNRPLKIYLVDDEEDYLIIMQKALQEKSFEVRTFSNGFDLFEGIEEEEPDVIITDLMMPVMSGHSLGYDLKNRFPNIKMVIVSAMDPEINKNRKEFWAEDTQYFQKPVDIDALCEHLNQLKT